MQAELVAKPSVSVEFVTHLGVTVPDFAWSGVQMNSNLYHESGLEARLALTKGQLKLAIPAPKNPVKLFKARYVRRFGLQHPGWPRGPRDLRPRPWGTLDSLQGWGQERLRLPESGFKESVRRCPGSWEREDLGQLRS